MKTYIGDRVMCLAQPENNDSQDGYNVLYSDGSETWLTKEIFEVSYRQLEEAEIQMIISTIVNDTLSEAELRSILDEETDVHSDGLELDLSMNKNSNEYEILSEPVSITELKEDVQEHTLGVVKEREDAE